MISRSINWLITIDEYFYWNINFFIIHSDMLLIMASLFFKIKKQNMKFHHPWLQFIAICKHAKSETWRANNKNSIIHWKKTFYL